MEKLQKKLGQYFTPAWAAELIVQKFFPDLKPGDVALEMCCGEGRFLQALPAGVRGVGVEIDPEMAARARERTGATVIEGDIRSVNLSGIQPSCVIGNPPFEMSILDCILQRAHALLPDDARAGFILPAYTFQTPSRTLRYHERWSIQADHLPRTLFPGLSKPLVFAVFTKERERRLVGFAFYEETASIARVREKFRSILESAQGSVWREAIAAALVELGGEASLSEIYGVLQGKRPTPNEFWQAQVRKVVNAFCDRTGPGTYALPGWHGERVPQPMAAAAGAGLMADLFA